MTLNPGPIFASKVLTSMSAASYITKVLIAALKSFVAQALGGLYYKTLRMRNVWKDDIKSSKLLSQCILSYCGEGDI